MGAQTLRMNHETGEVQAVRLDVEAMRAYAAELAPFGVTEGSDFDGAAQDGAEGGFPAGPGFEVQGVSPPDNRYPIALSGWDSDPIASKVGWVNSGCTGTMMSRQLIFSAAHCVMANGGGIPGLTFTPRKVGSNNPWGVGAVLWSTWPTAYTANGCHSNFIVTPSFNCHDYDIIVFAVSPSAFSPNPGWVGFRWDTDANLSSLPSISNIGYPGCGFADSPANCGASSGPYFSPFPSPWRDGLCASRSSIFSGVTGAAWWPWANGESSRIGTGCDTSLGHSGGAHFDPSGYMIANLQAYGTTTLHPSVGVRINSSLFSWMFNLKAAYP